MPCYLRAQRVVDSSYRSSAVVSPSAISQPTSSQQTEQTVEVEEVGPSTFGNPLVETSTEQILPTRRISDTAEGEEASPSTSRRPLQETSAEHIILPTLRRAADTARRCLFLECNDAEKRHIPDGLRKRIIKDFNFYIPSNARICNFHLGNYLFGNHPFILSARIKSRHIGSKSYYTYIALDRRLEGRNAILGYYCYCPVGTWTVGCCSHVMSILW